MLRAAALVIAIATLATSSPATAAPTPRAIPVTWYFAKASEHDIHDSMEVATTKKLLPGTVPVLSGFSLRFDNGDHKLRRVSVLARQQAALLTFSDANGDDPFDASAIWAVLDEGRSGRVTALGGGTFEIPIPGNAPADHVLVLTGFDLRRQDASDAHVRAIGVWLDGKRKVARVTFKDDQGPDFDMFLLALGKAIMDVATLGAYSALTPEKAVKKLNDGQKINGFRPYMATVQYAWVPSSAVGQPMLFTGTGDQPSSNMKLAGDVALTGFEFAFTNGDHHLLDFGITPKLATAGLSTGPGRVAFQDNNTDDPKKWAVAVVPLVPSK